MRRLIDACADDERTLCRESRRVGPARGAELVRLALERRQSAGQLCILADGRNASSPAHGSLWQRLREVARAIRVAAGGRNSGDAIAACRRSCGRIERRYEQALARPASPQDVPTLIAQRIRLGQQRDELLAMQY
jgi:hypothetical protein